MSKATAPVRLTRAQHDALDEALDPHDLTPLVQMLLEMRLTEYRDRHRHRATPAARARFRQQGLDLIAAARRLLELIPRASQVDFGEALHRESGRSEFQEMLIARLAQWEADAAKRSRPAARPRDRDRRILLWHAINVIDDGLSIKRSWHRDGPRVRVLRELLRLADEIDGKPKSRGSLRLIRDVARDYGDHRTWRPDDIRWMLKRY